MTIDRKRTYSFKEGLTLLAANDVGVDPYLAVEAGEDVRSILAVLRRAKTAKGAEKAKHIAAAQAELRKLNPKEHGKLVNALQAKVLALQGRGGDTAVAHLEPGEMVIPRSVLTPQLAQLIAAEAYRRGIDPKQFVVGSRRASINPATGAEEFGVGDWLRSGVKEIKSWFVTPEPEMRPARSAGYIEGALPEATPADLQNISAPNDPIGRILKPAKQQSSSNSLYRPYTETPETLRHYQGYSEKFQDALNKNDLEAAQSIYDDLRRDVLPSNMGFEPKRDPVTAQEKYDMSVIQGVMPDASLHASLANFPTEHEAWDGIKRNKNLDPVKQFNSITGAADYVINPHPARKIGIDNFLGPDGRIYERNDDTQREPLTGLHLLREFDSQLKRLTNRRAVMNGNVPGLLRSWTQNYEPGDRGSFY